MECTQRLECTQELHVTQSERINPEQIGFLGILGNKYPVNKGPNKIGRDPQTCNIILNLNSVSRQHAVLNVLNKKNFMLMDLDSANKTKLSGKALQPYIPHPISDGDTVQFGEIFGVFRLLEDDNELPMTQAIDIPDTPMPTRHVSRVNTITVPESPDVSDRDDSFIVPSQPKGLQLKNKTQHYIKPGKTISIQPIGSNKIDNVFWKSSKKSTSFNLDDSDKSFNDSIPSVCIKEKENINVNDIHELETQQFLPANNDSPESIYTANTQIPGIENGSIHAVNTQMPGSPSIHSLNTQLPGNTGSPSIHSLNTQMPGAFGSPSIHNLDTQVPNILPDVRKISDQQDMQIDLIAKENDIYDGDTEDFMFEKENIPITPNLDSSSKNSNKSKINTSEEEVLFDEVDNGPVEELESQAILTEDYELPFNKDRDESDPVSQLMKPTCSKRNMRIQSDDTQPLLADDIELPINKALDDSDPTSQLIKPTCSKRTMRIQSDDTQPVLMDDIELPINSTLDQSDPISQIVKPKCAKRNMRIQSDDATDCEDDIDILPTQVIPKLPEGDETDCEEITEAKSPLKTNNQTSKDDDIDDDATQDLEFDYYNAPPITTEVTVDLEDMPTQVLHNESIEKVAQNRVAEINNAPPKTKELDFEDMPTQVLETDNIEKVPMVVQNPVQKELTKPIDFEDLATQVLEEDVTVNKSYENNQFSEEIVISPFKVPSNSAVKPKKKEKLLKLKPISDLSKSFANNDNYYQCTQDVLEELCTQGVDSPKYTTRNNVKNVQSPKSQRDEDVNKNVSKLSMKEIREVIGVNSPLAKPVKVPSDGSTSSDLEITPKKSRLHKVMNTDLPNSQEIKTGVSVTSNSHVTESSSDSESDNKNVEEQNTPIVHRRTKKKSSGIMNVTKKLDVDNLPKRILTRPRRPTAKLQEAQSNSILKPKYLTGQEDSLDEEIITENITRLRNEMEKSKSKSKKESNQDIKLEDSTKDVKSTTVKKERVYTKKLDKDVKVDKSETFKKDSSKDKKRTKKEPNNNKKERTSKNSNTSRDVTKLDSTVETNLTRSLLKSIEADITLLDTISPIRTRSKRAKQNIVKTDEQSSKSKEKSRAEHSPERESRTVKRKRAKKEERDSPSPVKEVRRSRRQKTKEPAKVKSILKKSTSLEQSVVYHNSGSNSDSPRSLKRPALEDSYEPSSKRIRQTKITNNLSLRATPARMARTQYVLFTAFPVEEVRVKLESMGAVIVTDVMKCTVLLTLQVKRTFKLLCAVGLGKPIVGPNWVQACSDTNTIVDPWLYIIKDEVAEKRFQFSLDKTLVGRRNFLQGYNVSSTPNVMPNQFEMKLIVECSGGTWSEGGPKWLCVTCSSDRHLWPALNKLGAILVTTELILGGVLRQKLEIEANKVHLVK